MALIPRAKDSTYEGDVYGVFHMALPDDYIKDAERRARNEAIKYLYENAQPKYTYNWQLDGIYAKKEWGVSGGMLGCGNFVRFSDPQFLSEPVDIRITAVKTYLCKLHSPEITISNNVSGKSLGSILNEIPAKEQEIERGKNEAIEFTKRRFRDAKETMEMLKESLLDFSEGINPITVQTMMMLVGDESLQFRFVDAQNKPIENFQFRYDEENKWLITENEGVYLQHLTLGIKDITSEEGKEKEYKTWQMPADGWKSAPLDANQKRYLYAKCSKTGSTGIFETSPTAIAMDTEGGPDYYFLVGVLNSEYEGERSYVPLYGFTEILPGRITTDRVVSSDGESYLDLANNAFKLGNGNNSLEYNIDTNKPNTLTVTNATVRKALNVDGVADIAGFEFSNQNIRSEAKTEGIDAMLLDGKNGILQFNNHTQRWSENNNGLETKKQYIRIDSTNDAKIVARNETDGDVAYLSSQGIFSNRAGINALPAIAGVELKASIAGLGFGKMDKTIWNNQLGIVGVYGTASNNSNNPAPAYGGWFDNLKVNGLMFGLKSIQSSNIEDVILKMSDTYVINWAMRVQPIYLPVDAYEGTMLLIKSVAGTARIYPPNGQLLIENVNRIPNYIDLGVGGTAICVYIGNVTQSGVQKPAWSIGYFGLV